MDRREMRRRQMQQEEMRRRELERRRRIRKRQRIRQRNQRVALIVGLLCIIVWISAVNIRKNKEEEASEAYAKQQETKAEEKKKESKKVTTVTESENGKWYLQLVNAKNPMTEDEIPEIELKSINGSNYKVDARIYDDLQDMIKDAWAAGRNPIIQSAFRQWGQQETLYKNKINRVIKEKGLDEEEAAVQAATVVARPGTSEHQLGLALDIVSSEYTNLDEGQMETEDQKWLIENSWKYGFILRYPLDKSDITGVIFEPWHYRYVGKKAAKEITEQGITLEEYLGEEAVGYPEV